MTRTIGITLLALALMASPALAVDVARIHDVLPAPLGRRTRFSPRAHLALRRSGSW